MFIRVAEEAGLIGALTRWALDTALQQVQGWQARGLDLVVQVNVSALDLRDPSFPERVASALARHGVAGERLRLELTESAVMEDPLQGTAVVTRLAALGVHVVIDDFGTGYSSLAYLSRLATDEIKIDRGFVQRLTTGSTDATIVTSIIGLGRGLGLAVVAEGVEDAATLELLRAWGCTAVQGYYVARPLPAAEVAAWVRARGGGAGGD